LNLTLIGSHSLRVEVPEIMVWYLLTSTLSVVAITAFGSCYIASSMMIVIMTSKFVIGKGKVNGV